MIPEAQIEAQRNTNHPRNANGDHQGDTEFKKTHNPMERPPRRYEV